MIKMRTPIENGTTIQLCEVGTDKTFAFCIKELVGMGGSCIVYTAVYTDAENNRFTVRLKELYPEWLDLSRDGIKLSVPDDKADSFAEAMRQFTDGYQKQMQFHELPESMNSIANIQGIYEGNGTKYIAMSCQNAVPLSDDMSLYDIFRVIRAITLQIADFHDNGYLYLDLKPQNILLYPETPEMVMLFDFDSAIPMDDIQPAHLSCTDSWAAPEILQRKYNEIGRETDIYGIGAILLYLLFHRTPALSDRRRSASWDNEIENSLLKTERPEIKCAITSILSQTLAASPTKRYSSCDDILDVIEPIITEYQKPKPYLKTFLPIGNNFFCGRDTEIAEIHDALTENDILVLHGIGGIGKTELAKHYAKAHSAEYDAAVFVRFQKDILHTVISDSNFPIANCERSEDENDNEYFERKITILQTICTSRHMIILDNFDVDDCEELDYILGLQCKLLITSRCDQSDTFPQINIDILNNEQDLIELIQYYYKTEIADESVILAIINAVQGHTMALELIAKHMQALSITPDDMIALLEEKGIVSGSDGNVRSLKDGALKKRSAYEHISALFSIFGLSEDIKQVLRYSALIGPNLIDLDDYIFCCELTGEQCNALENAIKRGWIESFEVDEEKSYLSLHPLISDVLCNELKPDIGHCERFILSASFMTEEICNYSNDERERVILWLDHTAHTIQGYSPAVTMFLDDMCANIYFIEYDIENVEWCHKKIIELIYDNNKQDNYKKQLLNSYLFLRYIDKNAHGNENSGLYLKEIKELDTPAALSLLLEENCETAINIDNYELAMELSQERLKIALEQNDEYIAKAYNQLGDTELKFGNDDAAHDYYIKAAEYMEKWINVIENDSNTIADELARAYRDLGNMYYYGNEPEKALTFYFKSAETYDREYGESNTNSAVIYNFISDAYDKLDDKEKQVEYIKKAIAVYERVYSREHQETIQLYDQLYAAYFNEFSAEVDLSHLKEASEVAELLVEITENVYGETDFITAKYYKQCASVYKYLYNKERCLYYTKLACTAYEKLYESDDPDLILHYDVFADYYVYFGDTDSAKILLKKALKICEIIGDTEQYEEISRKIQGLG